LTGPDGLLKALTKTVIETALDEEMSEHLGYDKHDPSGRNSANSRNRKRSKTVLTGTVGQVDLEVPRDRDGTFEPCPACCPPCHSEIRAIRCRSKGFHPEDEVSSPMQAALSHGDSGIVHSRAPDTSRRSKWHAWQHESLQDWQRQESPPSSQRHLPRQSSRTLQPATPPAASTRLSRQRSRHHG
jgi:Transposase, Mutator family